MGIPLRKLWKNKPKQWGPFSAVQSALFHNAEQQGFPLPEIAYPFWESAGKTAHSYGTVSKHSASVNGWENNYLVHGPSELITYTTTPILSQPVWTLLVKGQYRGSSTNINTRLLYISGGGGDYFFINSYYGGLDISHANNYVGIISGDRLTQPGWANKPFDCAYRIASDTDHRMYLGGDEVDADTSTSIGQGNVITDQIVSPSYSQNDWLLDQLVINFQTLTLDQIAYQADNPYFLWQPVLQKTIFPPLDSIPSGAPDYAITANETITVTVPASALTDTTVATEADTTFTITADAASDIVIFRRRIEGV